jgi:hypothetical protein
VDNLVIAVLRLTTKSLGWKHCTAHQGAMFLHNSSDDKILASIVTAIFIKGFYTDKQHYGDIGVKHAPSMD